MSDCLAIYEADFTEDVTKKFTADFTADLKPFFDVFVFEDLTDNFTPNSVRSRALCVWTPALRFRSTMEVRLDTVRRTDKWTSLWSTYNNYHMAMYHLFPPQERDEGVPWQPSNIMPNLAENQGKGPPL